MRAAAFGASVRGGDDKARCNEFVGAPVRFTERIDALERMSEAGSIADDAGGRFHKAAKFRARRLREGRGGSGGTRRPVRLRCVIAQSSSDSVRKDHGLQQ